MKRLFVLIVLVFSLIVMTACDSEEVKKAKECYENEEYAKAVKILSKEKIEKDDYETKDVLTFSEAHILLDENKYCAAVEKAETNSEGKESEDYKKIYKEAISKATENYNAKEVVGIFKIDESKAKSVFKKTRKACNKLEYKAFAFLENIYAGIKDGKIKKKITSYLKDNWKKKVQSFLLSDWEWVEKAKERTVVRVSSYKDDYVGKITKVGTLEAPFHYKKDDLYWQKFDITDEKSVICQNLAKTEDGTPTPETVTMHLNYKKSSISIHLTGTEEYDLVVSDRIWKRLSD